MAEQLMKQRKRGVILTQQALDQLNQARSRAEFEENQSNRFTLEELNGRTALAVDTLMKIFGREIGVDVRSLRSCFSAFGLSLKASDYYHPEHLFQLKESTSRPNADLADGSYYLHRPEVENSCYESLTQPGALLRLKAPSLMGKTVLMNVVLQQLAQQDYQTVKLSFELADRQTHFTSLDRCLRWLCINVARELAIPSQIEDYWDEANFGSKVSCSSYFEDYLLRQSPAPLILCLDDVDLLFPYPLIYEDFFSLLRTWHEKAKNREIWKKLRLGIIHATDVYMKLNINQSPFNVGIPVELPEFKKEQVKAFALHYGLSLSTALLDLLMEMIGGHPYLLALAVANWQEHPEIDWPQRLCTATTNEGIYGAHLREHILSWQDHPQLAAEFEKVVMAPEAVQIEPVLGYQLYSMGLVTWSGNRVQPRCHLYRQYFADYFQQQHSP